MINWILNLIGITIYFLGKYKKRTFKTKPSFRFWISDNWVELLQTLLLNIAIMIIISLPDVVIKIDSFIREFVPIDFEITPMVGKAIASFATGWFFTFVIYRSVNSKKQK